MRLGILVFDNAAHNGQADEPAADALCAVLRSRDVDVVINAPEPDALTTPERPAPAPAGETTTATAQIASFADAQEAGGRLSRADCDGVLFWLGAGANPAFAPPAALSLACPILLCGAPGNAAFYDMAGVLADRGTSFDRLLLPKGEDSAQPADFVHAWLNLNSKKERQTGTEAAQRLFGKRLIVSSEAAQTVDAAQWFHQFGVLVTSATNEAGKNDLVVENGNLCPALTLFLLQGICEKDAAIRAIEAGKGFAEEGGDGEPATLVQIYRRKGRFTCLLALGSPAQAIGFANALFGNVLYAAPGDVRIRMKAACFALDIDVVEWGTGAAFSVAPV